MTMTRKTPKKTPKRVEKAKVTKKAVRKAPREELIRVNVIRMIHSFVHQLKRSFVSITTVLFVTLAKSKRPREEAEST